MQENDSLKPNTSPLKPDTSSLKPDASPLIFHNTPIDDVTLVGWHVLLLGQQFVYILPNLWYSRWKFSVIPVTLLLTIVVCWVTLQAYLWVPFILFYSSYVLDQLIKGVIFSDDSRILCLTAVVRFHMVVPVSMTVIQVVTIHLLKTLHLKNTNRLFKVKGLLEQMA